MPTTRQHGSQRAIRSDNDAIGTEVGTVVPSDPNPGQELMVYVIDPTHKFSSVTS